MTVTVELATDTEDLALGGLFAVAPDAEIDFEPLVRSNGHSTLRARGIDPDTITETLAEDTGVHSVSIRDAFDDSTLFDVEWASAPTESRLSEVLAAHDATVVRQAGTHRGWQFKLRFPDSTATKAFQRECHEAGISLGIQRVSKSTESDDVATRLTDAQRDVFGMALEGGYFDIPRRTTLVEIAADLGISDQAVSERLRRAQTKIGETAMRTNGPTEF